MRHHPHPPRSSSASASPASGRGEAEPADKPRGHAIALRSRSGAVHHVIGEKFGARLRRVHDPLADQITERLGGTAAERAVARAAIEARYRVFIRETESAVQLDRL